VPNVIADALPIPPFREGAGHRPADPRLWKAAGDFEEVFLAQFVRAMRGSPHEEGILEPSAGRETYDAMFSDALASQMAKRDAFGLRESIYRALGGAYEVTDTVGSGRPARRPDSEPTEKNDAP